MLARFQVLASHQANTFQTQIDQILNIEKNGIWISQVHSEERKKREIRQLLEHLKKPKPINIKFIGLNRL